MLSSLSMVVVSPEQSQDKVFVFKMSVDHPSNGVELVKMM